MTTATMQPEKIGTVWTATATLMDSSGQVVAHCIDTPNAIAKALMEMPDATTVKGLEGSHPREHWQSRMQSWNVAKSGLVKASPLQAARAESQEVKQVVKEMPALLGTLSQEDATELVAGLDLRIDSLEGRIDQGQATLEAMKEGLNPEVAKLTELIPTTKEGKGEITHITVGQYKKVWGRPPKPVILTQDGKRVRWEYALDEIAQQLHLEQRAQALGKAPDEYLKELIEDAKDTKTSIKATADEIESDKRTVGALEKLKETIKARTAKETTGPLLQKIAHPRVQPSAKPKPITKAKTILASVAQELIQKTQAKRSPRAIVIDNNLLARQVVPLTRVEVWVNHPNRVDLQGIDTPGARGTRVKPGVGYRDKGKARLSRTHHKGFSRVKYP